ncbi:LysM peptidoglycan-binding domain-containing protein [Planotetraspora kaengkrachanensis]|uniref:LysM peptidoglycan-binding domain-containing protein n=1 Tax=Planotetraspora kaengkrachanensis TaxID=575193 RepID=UPI00194537FA|nr:LysM peptidoglycan-binding domain-containing protein [Planotetraspora kaengkrachanensis]
MPGARAREGEAPELPSNVREFVRPARSGRPPARPRGASSRSAGVTALGASRPDVRAAGLPGGKPGASAGVTKIAGPPRSASATGLGAAAGGGAPQNRPRVDGAAAGRRPGVQGAPRSRPVARRGPEAGDGSGSATLARVMARPGSRTEEVSGSATLPRVVARPGSRTQGVSGSSARSRSAARRGPRGGGASRQGAAGHGRTAPPLRLTRRGKVVLVAAVTMAALGVLWLGTLAAVTASTGPASPAHDGLPYVDVRRGDTLWTIADAVGDGGDPSVMVRQIMNLNGLSDSLIRPGTRLYVPSGMSPANLP